MPSDADSLLILFDGHALIHRGFHALPGLATKKGQSTGAVYGFATMILRVLSEYRPGHCAVTFDSATPTFRHEQFEEYKAHRPAAPDELVSQFSLVRVLVGTFNIPSFEVPGYEADDILGTLSRQAREKGIETIIVTGDTDMLQLVSPGIKVLLPKAGKPFSDTQLYDEKAVLEKYELHAGQLTDLKGLVGDPSDNIPGVPGVGKKTATKLLQEFGSIEEIYRRIDEVTPQKLQQKLREHEPEARQSRELVTIVTDAPVSLDMAACRTSDYDREKIVALFRELEFHSLLNKLPETAKADKPSTIEEETISDYQTVTDTGSLDALMRDLSNCSILAFDTETTSLNARQASLAGISLSTGAGRGWYIPVGHAGQENQLSLELVISRLRPILEDRNLPKIAHNAKYDITVLARYGLKVDNLYADTMIAAYLLGEKALGLKQLAFSRLGVEMAPITELIGSGSRQISMAEVDITRAADYACADADMTWRLHRLLEPELRREGLWNLFAEVEMPLTPVLQRIEENGIALDAALLQGMSREMEQEIQRIENEIYAWVGHQFNINSSQQLGRVLFEELKLPPSRRTKSGFSTDAAVLEGLRGIHPAVGYILDYRQMAKLKSTYVDALPSLVDPDTGRLHTSFNQTATATGRLSSSEPNLQNIPIRTEIGRKIRRAFTAPGNHVLLGADYSQIELRVMAQLSRDPGLLEAFSRGEDIHTATAATVFSVPPGEVTAEMRRLAKVVNFGVIYGMSDYGLEQATGLTRQEAADFIASYFARYGGIKDYLETTRRQAAEKGYVQTLLGRRRYIPEIRSSNYQTRQAAERMAINMPVQGTAADIIKLAMIRIDSEMNRRGLRSRMILQVHDELLFEVPDDEIETMKQMTSEIMPAALEFDVPLEVEIKSGRNWGDIE